MNQTTEYLVCIFGSRFFILQPRILLQNTRKGGLVILELGDGIFHAQRILNTSEIRFQARPRSSQQKHYTLLNHIEKPTDLLKPRVNRNKLSTRNVIYLWFCFFFSFFSLEKLRNLHLDVPMLLDGVNSSPTSALPNRLSNSDAVTHHADSKIKICQPPFFREGLLLSKIKRAFKVLF